MQHIDWKYFSQLIHVVWQTKRAKEIAFINNFYPGGFIAYPDDEELKRQLKRCLELLHVQKVYLTAFVCRRLNLIDRFMFLRLDKFYNTDGLGLHSWQG
jgi:hypothetical protein